MIKKTKVSAAAQARADFQRDQQDRGVFHHLKRKALEALTRDLQARLLTCAKVCNGFQGQIATQAKHVKAAEDETAALREQNTALGQKVLALESRVVGLGIIANHPPAQSVLSYYADEYHEKPQDVLLFLKASIPYLEGLRDGSGLSEEGAEYVDNALDAMWCLRRLVGLLVDKRIPFNTGPESWSAEGYGKKGAEVSKLPGLERQAE